MMKQSSLLSTRSILSRFSPRRAIGSERQATIVGLDPEKKGVGFESRFTKDKYVNPLLTPPPRSPSSPHDFRHPETLGHWFPYGWDWTSPKADKYMMNEMFFMLFTGGIFTMWLWSYGPDYKLRDWAKREAYFRTHKREALGLPLIDVDVVDRDRIVLPTEEELGDFPVTL